MTKKFLIFDCDDTLWENNIYFEEAFESFCSYLAHSSLSPEQVRVVLDEIEIANAKIHGYGSRNFGRNLAMCFEKIAEREVSPRDLEIVKEFAHDILEKPIELIEGVKETVEELASRHHLTLFTKGDREEQRLKIDRSGLAQYFQHTGIVKEKNPEAYRVLVKDCNLILEETWMIGNSPKSDINPALTAGLGAVFVPHARTWSLEHDEIPHEHPKLLQVQQITELVEHF